MNCANYKLSLCWRCQRVEPEYVDGHCVMNIYNSVLHKLKNDIPSGDSITDVVKYASKTKSAAQLMVVAEMHDMKNKFEVLMVLI